MAVRSEVTSFVGDQLESDVELTRKLDAITLADQPKFRCHDFSFSLSATELRKIPYLEILCANAKDFKEKPDDNGIILLNESCCEPGLMKSVIKYIKTDRFRCLFSDLPENTKASKLFDLLDYLCVDKPKCSLNVLSEQLKNIRSIREKHEYQTADRSLARDACVKLCWSGRDLVGPREQHKLYNLVLFIMSHPRTFYFRLREVTLDWYLQYFQVTDKQQGILKKWLKDCPRKERHFEEDGRSSSGGSPVPGLYEHFFGYDSD